MVEFDKMYYSGNSAVNICKMAYFGCIEYKFGNQGPVVQSVVSLTSSLRVISLTVLADSIYNFLKFFAYHSM